MKEKGSIAPYSMQIKDRYCNVPIIDIMKDTNEHHQQIKIYNGTITC